MWDNIHILRRALIFMTDMPHQSHYVIHYLNNLIRIIFWTKELLQNRIDLYLKNNAEESKGDNTDGNVKAFDYS